MQSLSVVHAFITHMPASVPVPQMASPPPVYEQSALVVQLGWHELPIFVLQMWPCVVQSLLLLHD